MWRRKQPSEEHVPGEYEPRIAHAAQRHHRIQRNVEEESRESGKSDSVPGPAQDPSAGKHLLSLINDVLDLSKIEAGKMGLHLENFEVAPLIDEMTAALNLRRPRTAIRFTCTWQRTWPRCTPT